MSANPLGIPVHMTGRTWLSYYLTLSEHGLLDLSKLASLRREDMRRYGLHDSDWPIATAAKSWRQMQLTGFDIQTMHTVVCSQAPDGSFSRTLGGVESEVGATYRVLEVALLYGLSDCGFMRQAADYLCGIRLRNGGLPPCEGQPADVGTTARALLVLLEVARGDRAPRKSWAVAAEAMRRFLEKSAEDDEGAPVWRYVPSHCGQDDEPPAIASTALAVRSLNRTGTKLDLSASLEWLESHANPVGGWDTGSYGFAAGPTFWSVRTLLEGHRAPSVCAQAIELANSHLKSKMSIQDQLYLRRTSLLGPSPKVTWQSLDAEYKRIAPHVLAKGASIYNETAHSLLLLCETRNVLGTPYDRQAPPRHLLTLPSEPFSGDPKEWSARDVLYQYVRVPAVWRALIWLESSISLDEVGSLILAAVVATGSVQSNFATVVIAAHPDWLAPLRLLLGVGIAIWVVWKLGVGRSRRAVLGSLISLALGIGIVGATESQFGLDQLLSALAVALYIDLLSSFIDLVGLFQRRAV